MPVNAKAKELLGELEQDNDFLPPWNRYAFQTFFRLKADELFKAGPAALNSAIWHAGRMLGVERRPGRPAP